MDNWIMLMEHYPLGEEIKLEGLQDENSKVGYGVSEIVSIEKVKCVEVKAPEYYPSGEGEESKTYKEKISEFYEKNKILILSLGLVTLIKVGKNWYDNYMIKNYYVDGTYMPKTENNVRGPEENKFIEAIDNYLYLKFNPYIEEKESNINTVVSVGKELTKSSYNLNEDSKYFIMKKIIMDERKNEYTVYFKVMPRDYRPKILNFLENLAKENKKIDLSEISWQSSVVKSVVEGSVKEIELSEYVHLEECIKRNKARKIKNNIK